MTSWEHHAKGLIEQRFNYACIYNIENEKMLAESKPNVITKDLIDYFTRGLENNRELYMSFSGKLIDGDSYIIIKTEPNYFVAKSTYKLLIVHRTQTLYIATISDIMYKPVGESIGALEKYVEHLKSQNLSITRMPKVIKTTSLHSKAPKTSNLKKDKDGDEDMFARANHTNFVAIPSNIKFEPIIAVDKFKQLDKSQLPLTLDTKDFAELTSGSDKIKQKRESFLSKLDPVNSSLLLKRRDKQRQILELTPNTSQQQEGLDNLNKDFISSVDNLLDDDQLDSKPKSTKMTNQKKANISNKEIQQYKNVLAHPDFKSNPFLTLQEHLQNSVNLENEKLKQEQEMKKQLKKQLTKKKKSNNNVNNPITKKEIDINEMEWN
ncbi:hypothetical protein DLAC_03583 [Tieghemostelium lacteum]|uniref:Uncharacterized protein n=1 Tax=Tieghemostelium lacteum TaxID=361077 RepID=A0A152A0K5_TIELA|nr:hypothetical protein DLAC_03583 [Tieghemostelium lacteum]|eukprot:KYQ99646.1 hypothetical protein DLAC_03583 [Tieghemostelium lacteum]